MAVTDADAERRRGLRRMQRIAVALLVVALVIFVVARRLEGDHDWAGYVRAAAEGAVVGALADWFAVVALFRHPLGIPIPHTAIIPRKKDQLGRQLGAFVEQQFLTPESLGARIRSAAIAARVGRWLAESDNAARAAGGIADAIRTALRTVRPEDLRDAVQSLVLDRLEAVPAAPTAGRLVHAVIRGGHHVAAFDAVIAGAQRFLDEHGESIRERMGTERPWWLPAAIDEAIMSRVVAATSGLLRELAADPDHPLREQALAQVRAFATRLEEDPALGARGEELKHRFLASDDVRGLIDEVWRDLSAGIDRAAADPDSVLRGRAAELLRSYGQRLVDEPSLQERADAMIERIVVEAASRHGNEVAALIEETVARWDARDASDRLELQVGRDLQFIRINGTVVGGLAGVLIYAATAAIV